MYRLLFFFIALLLQGVHPSAAISSPLAADLAKTHKTADCVCSNQAVDKKLFPIFIIGCMGSGKSTIGRELSLHLDMPYQDTDIMISSKLGKSINAIHKECGSQGFFKIEQELLQDIMEEHIEGMIFSTGGGIILDPLNRELLSKNAFVIYLETSVEELFERINGNYSSRPLLRVSDPRSKLTSILTERERFYKETADLVINTDGKSVREIVLEIAKFLQEMK